MNDEELLALFKEALTGAAPEVIAALTVESKLADLGIDSIKALEMAGYVENKLLIRFYDEELAQVNSIRDLIRLVRAATAKRKDANNGHQSIDS